MVETLFVITSDPRTSHRPAEAIRIAAGISAWKKLSLSVCLCGPAARCLDEFPDELIQGANIARYLPTLAEQAKLYVTDTTTATAPAQPLRMGELTALAARMRYVLHF